MSAPVYPINHTFAFNGDLAIENSTLTDDTTLTVVCVAPNPTTNTPQFTSVLTNVGNLKGGGSGGSGMLPANPYAANAILTAGTGNNACEAVAATIPPTPGGVIIQSKTTLGELSYAQLVTPTAQQFLRDDGVFATPAGGSGGMGPVPVVKNGGILQCNNSATTCFAANLPGNTLGGVVLQTESGNITFVPIVSPSDGKFLRDDGSFVVPPAGGGGLEIPSPPPTVASILTTSDGSGATSVLEVPSQNGQFLSGTTSGSYTWKNAMNVPDSFINGGFLLNTGDQASCTAQALPVVTGDEIGGVVIQSSTGVLSFANTVPTNKTDNKFLRDDGTFVTPPAAGGGLDVPTNVPTVSSIVTTANGSGVTAVISAPTVDGQVLTGTTTGAYTWEPAPTGGLGIPSNPVAKGILQSDGTNGTTCVPIEAGYINILTQQGPAGPVQGEIGFIPTLLTTTNKFLRDDGTFADLPTDQGGLQAPNAPVVYGGVLYYAGASINDPKSGCLYLPSGAGVAGGFVRQDVTGTLGFTYILQNTNNTFLRDDGTFVALPVDQGGLQAPTSQVVNGLLALLPNNETLSLPVGTNGQVLSYTTNPDPGYEWIDAASGGLQPPSATPVPNQILFAGAAATDTAALAPPVTSATVTGGILFQASATDPSSAAAPSFISVNSGSTNGQYLMDTGVFANLPPSLPVPEQTAAQTGLVVVDTSQALPTTSTLQPTDQMSTIGATFLTGTHDLGYAWTSIQDFPFTANPTQQFDGTKFAVANLPVQATNPAVNYDASTGLFAVVSSSLRYKKDIESLSGNEVGNEIDRLRPVSFAWKSDEFGSRQSGFVAEEVQEVMPSRVFWKGSKRTFLGDNEALRKSDENAVIESVDYIGMIAPLVAVAQNLRKRVRELEDYVKIPR